MLPDGTQSDAIVAEQIAYYRARAGEYDEWFMRQGRYDHGEEHRRQWLGEVQEVRDALSGFAPRGRVLELAGGTGWWTQELARHANTLSVVDSSAEVVAINRARMEAANARGIPIAYEQGNLFSWRPDERWDVVFFSFWLSHVPPERFAAFWATVASCLAPGARVWFIDSLYSQTGTAGDQPLPSGQASTTLRHLNDGRTYQIVKVFYRPGELEARLEALGWTARVRATPTFFLYGEAVPSAPSA
jgi:SAM-dependent methyltransferase